MVISIDLPDNQVARLQAEAERLGVRPEDLARAMVSDLLNHPDEDFEAAVDRVLQKNQELYQRLS